MLETLEKPNIKNLVLEEEKSSENIFETPRFNKTAQEVFNNTESLHEYGSGIFRLLGDFVSAFPDVNATLPPINDDSFAMGPLDNWAEMLAKYPDVIKPKDLNGLISACTARQLLNDKKTPIDTGTKAKLWNAFAEKYFPVENQGADLLSGYINSLIFFPEYSNIISLNKDLYKKEFEGIASFYTKAGSLLPSDNLQFLGTINLIFPELKTPYYDSLKEGGEKRLEECMKSVDNSSGYERVSAMRNFLKAATGLKFLMAESAVIDEKGIHLTMPAEEVLTKDSIPPYPELERV